MKIDEIERIQKLNAEIQNFRDCYNNLNSQLWGGRDSCVSAESLMSFLIENPELQKIAETIEKLNAK
jgi:hypothetical protein